MYGAIEINYMNKNTFKSIGAVILGFSSVAVLSIATDFLMGTLGIFPKSDFGVYTQWMLVVALAYRSIFTIFGGYVTARLAPQNPMRHVYVLMVLGLVGGTAGAIGGWSYGNHWYPVLLAITGPFFVWTGGKLYKQK